MKGRLVWNLPLIPAMNAYFLVALLLCFKQLRQIEQFNHDDWMVITAVIFISIALMISHKVHMLTGR